MRYRYRAARKAAKKSKYNFLATIIIITFLLFATVNWILPNLIQGLGFIRGFFNTQTPKKITTQQSSTLAPPVLNIPYEATNSGKIMVKGYGTPKTKVLIFVDESRAGETESLEDGYFEVKDISLNLGSNSIFGKTQGGNTDSLPSKIIKVFFDSEKPTLDIYEPGDNTEVHGDKKVKVSGKTESGVKVFVNNRRVISNSDGTFSLDYPLNEGDNTLIIRAEDIAQNLMEIQRRVIFK
ncbi:hypothetical protein A3H81_00730 [Candidatus Daviesbacteria bacterium RIFCSPLOWO2_02_FULL_38_18]|nr:MAG: hypothetical protein A2772_01710 [Candidatus Daviesbacteria bacterium RIFCSPHIGHO2_01_FULL_38_8b]OGE45311.1 MAG: hypothetical protein A3E67_02995 [Candidatus Daviesbacteria bacterium RIFCSPHIGHO2_12_FULL_38_25]OGE68790.1 MAG: hypothetical protein A3H81_00730 [Candidatus Daviesbacteria bacterium RIFCSPLOWO2_02_FULL_38_18]OGE73274.1 MAG: hypothetical protein A3H18_04405 [Candidatus Daviesbacteria bacterium RIFCSPLOWO2_12_FULL_38_10]HCB22740.1 hypothetical protein [Candidatus Daviesbacteri